MPEEPEENLTEKSYVAQKAEVLTFFGEEVSKKPASKKYLFIFGFLFLLALTFLSLLYFWRIAPSSPISDALPADVILEPFFKIEFNEAQFFQEWKEHVFHGRTSYQIEVGETGEKWLHATSQGTSSLLYKEVEAKSVKRPFLSWEWKVVQFPSNKENKNLAAKRDNDFAARVYVLFKGRTTLMSDVIQYVWDDHFPEGAHATSPFSPKTKFIVIQSGSTSGWVTEKRDLVRDYQMLFGKRPKGEVMAVGIMSDSDNTQTTSQAYFRNFLIEKPQTEIEESPSKSKWQLPIVGGAFSRIWQTATDRIEDLRKRLKA
ncbi:MAG: DUF3047 domain-containing protein [Candidatus Omnitrophica bacterium]|nr:DUF3047 domain-containing protein [Candidatus Omnitrophota bacterium]